MVYIYRTVISDWAHDPGCYNLFITRGQKISMNDMVRPIQTAAALDGYQLGYILEFEDTDERPAKGGILKAVMHDERGTWLRYQETTPPRFIEHAHYVKSETKIKLTPRKP